MDVVAKEGQEDTVAVALLQVGRHASAVDDHRGPGARDVLGRQRADRGHGFTVEGVLRDENLQGVEKIGLHAAQTRSRRLAKAAFAPR
jgi:hypothetical protein